MNRAAVIGCQPGLAPLESGRNLLLVTTSGRLSVPEAGIFGARRPDPEVIANYRRDLEPITRPDLLAPSARFPRLPARSGRSSVGDKLQAAICTPGRSGRPGTSAAGTALDEISGCRRSGVAA